MAFILVLKSRQFHNPGISSAFITLFGELCPPAPSPYGCGVLFIWVKVVENLRTDKHPSTLSFCADQTRFIYVYENKN